MKPHLMFFDEMYSEQYYRSDTVQKYVEEADCLIVIDNALETSFTSNIVDTFLQKDLPVIEFNPKSMINRGNNI